MVKRGSYFRENSSIYWENEREWSPETFLIAAVFISKAVFSASMPTGRQSNGFTYTSKEIKENVDGTDVEMVWSS
jgi:hypothetical protein